MKKLLTSIFLCFVGIGACIAPAEAHGYYRNNWVAPFVVGAGVGYLATRPYYQPYYYPPQVVYVQPPVYIQQSTQPSYVIPPPAGYHYADIIDPACNCQKVGLVPN